MSVDFSGLSLVPGSSDVLAVGSWYDSSSEGVVVEEWNGSKWEQLASPTFPSSDEYPYLSSIWAASRDDAWAVGSAEEKDGTSIPLVVHWNGTSWSIQNLTGLPSGSASLSGVDGTSASDVWCVGTADSNPLELHYSGHSWTVSQQGPKDATLSSVSFASADDGWAIGSTFTKTSSKPDVLHYDGSSWSTETPSIPKGAYVAGIAASRSVVWLVGDVFSSKGSTLWSRELTGTTWKSVPLTVTGKNPDLTGVVVVSGTTAFTGGMVSNSKNTNFSAFVEGFTGGKWSPQTLPSPGNGSSVVALAGSSVSNVWAVGGAFTGKVCESPYVSESFHRTTSWKLVTMPKVTTSAGHASRPTSPASAPRC